MSNYQSYFICTSPRSGSTLLCRLLKASGVAGDPRSYFHENSIAEWQTELGLSLATNGPEQGILSTVFQAVREQSADGTGLCGVRLQRFSSGFFFQKLAVLQPMLSSDRSRLEAEFGPTLFIYLTRADKVQQAVSYVKAQQTGLWHRAPDGTELERLSPPQDPVYDRTALQETHDLFLKHDRDWLDWFRSEGISPYRISYDQLSEDPTGTLRGLLQALGKDPGAAQGVDPGIAKLSDKTNTDWIRQLKAVLGR